MPEKYEVERRWRLSVTRRGFMKGGLAAAGAAVAGAACGRDQIYRAEYPEVPENRVQFPANGKSVLILGGGFGGLHAACELVDRGFKVTILEKTGVLGGKLKSWRDKEFGVPEESAGWPGYPRDHGIHAVWGSYNNLREFMGRHGYRLWKFPAESTIYNYVGRQGWEFQLGRKPTLPGAAGRIQALLQTHRQLQKIAGPEMGAMRLALLKMASFNYEDREQRRYLDGISFPEWARGAGMPEPVIYGLFGANSRMSMMDDLENTSALAILSLAATVSGDPEDMRVDTFLHPPGETYIAPLARYVRERGGEIISNTPVIRLNREGGKIRSVTAGDEMVWAEGSPAWKCQICGTVFAWPNSPARCPVCGAGAAELRPLAAAPVREYFADYYLSALDLPGAKQVISRSGLSGESYFDKILQLQETSVYTINLWYNKSGVWEKRFPQYADFFPSGFKFLGITINLSHPGEFQGRKLVPPLVSEYQNKNVCVIETQIANAERFQSLDDRLLVRLVHEELKIVMPELPEPADYYLNRWNNYSPQRVGDDARRPAIQSPLENLFLIGDWVQTDHLSAYMEKTCVAAKIAVNLILERSGRKGGRINILPSGTPSAIISACRRLFSVYL